MKAETIPGPAAASMVAVTVPKKRYSKPLARLQGVRIRLVERVGASPAASIVKCNPLES